MVGGLQSRRASCAPGRAVPAGRPAPALLRDPELAADADAPLLAIDGRDRVTGDRARPAVAEPGDHQATGRCAEAVDGCVRAGIPAIGLWRDRVAEVGLDEAAAAGPRRRPAGVQPVPRRLPHRRRPAGTARRARRQPARRSTRPPPSGTDVLVLVVGGLPPGERDLAGARGQVADGIAELAPYAAEHGVRLAHRAAAPDVLRRPGRDLHARPGAGPGRRPRRRSVGVVRRHLPRVVGPGGAGRRSPAPAAAHRRATRSATASSRSRPTRCSAAA